MFPTLLRKFTECINVQGGKNLASGFKQCGILPLDKTQVLQKFRNHTGNIQNPAEVTAKVSDILINLLTEKRGLQSREGSVKRREKIGVTPEKRIELQKAAAEVSKENTK